MVKSTVRFPEEVIENVEKMVEGELFSSKSEFQRFAVEYVLSEKTDHDPEMVGFKEIRADVFSDSKVPRAEPAADTSDEFVETAARVRQLAARGEIETAAEYLDSRYPPTDPRSMLLEDLIVAYRDADHRDK